ncbi:MAG: acyl-CoA thioesterase [Planctomycetes bacterium]|nr:acyl-CoA thioesterase [Planctomycetota bacterium]
MRLFETTIKVRFSDVDRAGIAYYPRVVHWLHVAFEEFWEGFVGVPYVTVLERENLGFPAVDLKVEFVKPTRFGELLRLTVALEEIGNSSSRFRYELFGAQGDLRARARVTVVCVALDTLKPQPLPERYRVRFAAALVAPARGS